MKIILSKKIYYYCCDSINDKGWGCVYRCLQNVLKFLLKSSPSILELMNELNIKYLPEYACTNMWIEPVDCVKILKKYKYKSKLVGYNPYKKFPISRMRRTKIKDFDNIFTDDGIINYIQENLWCPIIIDDGIMSYLIYGIDKKKIYILDPHIINPHPFREITIKYFLEKFWMMAVVY